MMSAVTLCPRAWVPVECERYVQEIAARVASLHPDAVERELNLLIRRNQEIHELDCVNLNPATNVMNPRAEAALARGLGCRPSLGYPGDKYEMGLEAIEQVEVIAAELLAKVFGAGFAEIRVPSGAIANLYVFMATARPGDAIIAPPPEIGGHVTHHADGAAGRYGVITHAAPIDAKSYSIDVDRLRADALRIRPKLITVGGSLNLFAHPLREIRRIADEVGAWVLFDAAHLSGLIAGRAWQQPLEEGAHVMTMSTYKSLGGPPAGAIVTNSKELAQRLDAIAYPGLTANFDVGKSAALAITLLDWQVHGRAYAIRMRETAKALATALVECDIPVFARDRGMTTSHQFAIEAAAYGGGQTAARLLRRANLLASGIGLPLEAVAGDANGLRMGVPEIVRWGMTTADMLELASLIADALTQARSLDAVASDASGLRRRFRQIHFVRD